MAKKEKQETPETKVENKQPTEQEKLQNELSDKNEQLLRIAAEYDNFRKRSQREREGIYSDAKVLVVKEFLPVIDNLERALQNTGDAGEDFKKGVDMTYNQINEILKKLGVEEAGKAGDKFDPNFHNAVMHEEDENLDENVISEVFVKGYKLGDKVLRPAMVKVVN